ncbi:MAG: hypothetical protein GTO14_16115 [Anaerolineales bacterium]|nr:hypothetical protein [Anaerolineales bacterium]
MGRRDRWTDRQLYMERQMKKRLHPAWRGVGCITIVVLGVVAYFFAGWFISAGLVYFPPALIRPPFAPFLPPGAFVQVVVALIFMVFSYAVLSIVYAIAFPIKPGETDAPPPRKTRRRRR